MLPSGCCWIDCTTKQTRLAHPGEQGDVPHRAVRHAQRPLLPGDDALTEAEIDQQIVLLGAEEGAGLEDGSGSQRLPEARRGSCRGLCFVRYESAGLPAKK